MNASNAIPKIEFDYEKSGKLEFELFDIRFLYDQGIKHEPPPTSPHRVAFHTLIYIESGEGRHCIDFEYYDFSPGTFIFVQPGQVHAWDFSNKPKGLIFVFTPVFIEQLETKMSIPFQRAPANLHYQNSPLLFLDEQNDERIRRLVTEIATEQAMQNTDSLVVMHLFSALYLLLNRLRPASPFKSLLPKQNQMFSEFLSLLEANFRRVRDANWYANNLHVTYKTLNQISKLATDRTVKQLIDDYAAAEIKRLLAISSVTIQTLAFDFGFDDISNFNKFFKKHVNMTPGQFQKQYSA